MLAPEEGEVVAPEEWEDVSVAEEVVGVEAAAAEAAAVEAVAIVHLAAVVPDWTGMAHLCGQITDSLWRTSLHESAGR